MSKVNDRGTSTQVLNQLKEQYQFRERENETRHREEVRELRDSHRAEMDKLKDETQKRIVDIQEETNVKLNQKDLQYQKEIDALKSLYARRLAESKKPGS